MDWIYFISSLLIRSFHILFMNGFHGRVFAWILNHWQAIRTGWDGMFPDCLPSLTSIVMSKEG